MQWDHLYLNLQCFKYLYMCFPSYEYLKWKWRKLRRVSTSASLEFVTGAIRDRATFSAYTIEMHTLVSLHINIYLCKVFFFFLMIKFLSSTWWSVFTSVSRLLYYLQCCSTTGGQWCSGKEIDAAALQSAQHSRLLVCTLCSKSSTSKAFLLILSRSSLTRQAETLL